MLTESKRKVLTKLKDMTKKFDNALGETLSKEKEQFYDLCNILYLREYKKIKVIEVIRVNNEKGIITKSYNSERIFKTVKTMERHMKEVLAMDNINFINMTSNDDVYFTRSSVGIDNSITAISMRDLAASSVLNVLLAYDALSEIEFISKGLSFTDYNPLRDDLESFYDSDINRAYAQERVDKKLACAFVGLTKDTNIIKFNDEFNIYVSEGCHLMEDIYALCSKENLKLVNAGDLGFFIYFK